MSLQLSDGMSYGELRECLLKRDRGQQRWGHLVANADAVPVEIDRVEWKGGRKGDGKKGGGKDGSKGKRTAKMVKERARARILGQRQGQSQRVLRLLEV